MIRIYASIIALHFCCHASASDDCYGFDRCLLANDANVRRELALSETQQRDAKRVLREYVEKRAELAERLKQGADEKQRRQVYEEGERELRTIDAKVVEMLDSPQRKRLREIAWRLLGVDAIFIERYRDTLGVSKEQFESLTPQFDAYGLAFKKWRKSLAVPDADPSFREMGKTEEQTLDALLAKLGPEIRRKHDEQGGKPIAFSKWEIKSSWSLGELTD